jgi:thiol-disulfide isomerase/thioredoxin
LGLGIKIMAAIAILGVVAVVFQAATNHQPASGIAQFQRGTLTALEVIPDPPPQPSQTFRAPDGSPTSLAAYRGQVILVNYWATWCPPCVKEMPTLAALHRTFEGQGFAVVAISVDREPDTEKSREELARLTDGALDFYHDPAMATVYPARARGFPTSILYDREGRELARLAGEADWNDPVAQGLVAHALGVAVPGSSSANAAGGG